MKTIQITSRRELDEAINAIARSCAGEGDAAASLAARQASVAEIVTAIREHGDEAMSEFTARFDRASLHPDEFEVTPAEMDAAYASVDMKLIAALEQAHANIRRFHEMNLRQSWEETSPDGAVMGQRVSAIESAGVYVPGGTAYYPSSVLMNIVPAKSAGVKEIVMVSPPSWNGTIHPLVLAAARIAGATRVFRIGGAQAVAALAYGTATIPAVLKITGPGNAYVTLAKRFVSTVCDIDKEAGPSEVVVLADGTEPPEFAAIEMLCQAEHDEDARPILVTTDAAFIAKVEAAIAALLPTLTRAEVIRKAIDANGQAYAVGSLDDAVILVNAIAPEHLSIQTAHPMSLLDRIENAGAIMLGAGTPVALCDYYAGPNHILPTGRRARYASALTVEDFRKVTNYVRYSPERLRREADDIIALATAEGLTAHAKAVELRK